MKTTEELTALKAEMEALNEKLAELTEDELLQVLSENADGSELSAEELEQVTGGMTIFVFNEKIRKLMQELVDRIKKTKPNE